MNDRHNQDTELKPDIAADTVLYDNKYRIISELGSGGFGKVYLAHDAAGKQVALKEIKKDLYTDEAYGQLKDYFRREIDILKKFYHEHVISINDAGLDPAMYIVMPYIEGSLSFSDWIKQGKSFTEEQIFDYSMQLLGGLKYIHSLDVIHRDMKPSNLLMDTKNNKLIIMDFGISKSFSICRYFT